MDHHFDPELRPWVSMLPVLDVRDLSAARATMASLKLAMPPYVPPDGVAVETRSVPGPSDAPDVGVIVFSPEAGGTRPALIYMHGGGFVMGDADGDKELPALLAAETGAVVVSVDYRLAPEHPFPAAVEDCYAALQWLSNQATEFGVDPDRIGIGGVSAGGGLAAGTALLARDRGGPRLCFQFLEVPELDDRLETASMRRFTDTPLWNRPNAIESWRHYLGPQVAGEEVSVYAAPSRASDLSGLPPAYVSLCEFDPLRDEGIAYSQALVADGVPTELHLYPGAFHGSSGLVPTAELSQRMRTEMVEAIRRGLEAPTRQHRTRAVETA